MTLPPPLPDKSRRLTIAQLILSIVAITFSLIAILVLIALAIAGPITPNIDISNTVQLLSIAWVVGLTLLIALPSLVFSIRRLRALPSPRKSRIPLLKASLGLILIPFLGFFGHWLIAQQSFAWLMAPVNMLLVILPLWWFFEVGRSHLNGGSRQRLWGLSAFSVFITLPLVMFVEIGALVIGIIMFLFWMFQQAEFAPLLQQIQQKILTNPLELQNLSFDFTSLLQNPSTIIALLAGVAVVIPLIEELLKPLALWVLAKRNLTPQEGFVAGMVCGATFALLESVFSMNAVPADNWLITLTGRLGTGLLHVFTAGLNGWALTSTWRDGKVLRLGGTYILTVIIHGAWNIFALLMGIYQVGNNLPVSINPALSHAAVWVLAGIALIILGSLILVNRKLRKSDIFPLTPPPIPMDTSLQ